MEPTQLTWLKTVEESSIDSWHALKKAFVKNFQGTANRLDSEYALKACKQHQDESLREYNRRFWEKKSTYVHLTKCG